LRAGADLRYAIGDGAALMGYWAMLFRRAPFEGQSVTDPTITRASLTHFEHLFGLGIALTL
jgi:hypothetical protein